MTGKAPRSEPALRQQAETRLRKKAARAPEKVAALSAEATTQLLHELHVHQIELEMQNEELRDSQAALEGVRARYFDLYDLAPVGYCTVSEAGLIMQANLCAATLLGLTRVDLVGKALTRFIHKEDGDRYYLHRKKLMESGEAQACELRMIGKDGRQIWAHLAATVAHNAQGAPELRVVLGDITERKQAEAALSESSERYRNLFNSIDEGFCVIEMLFDPSGKPSDYRFLEVNPSFEKQSGLHAATGKRMREFAPHLESYWFENYGRVALTGEPMRFADEAKELNHRWFDVYAFRIGGPESRKVAVIFSDSTERKNVELKLTEAKLAAEKANRAKTEFLSSMSHELRTPLNAILGFAQLLEAGTPALTESQKRSIERILKAGWYLLEMINEILDLAKVESGQVMLSNEPVALANVMLECRAMIEPEAQKRGIGIAFPSFDAPCFVLADRTRLTQVLANLLSNAIKYNRPDGAAMVECAPKGVDKMRISVRDTGLGLTPEQLAQLFQPFNRLGKEAGAEEGTGIGLVVTKRLVELMGGTMGVASTVGAGSVFWVELSLTEAPQLEPQRLAQLARVPPATPAGAPVRTLLYVEDNPANLTLVQQIIERRPDLRLLTATDGSRGIELARSHRPDVVLMDINLPGISGSDAMRILRADPSTGHIPIIAISANAMPHDIERALSVGFFSYITKPIRINELVEALDVALEMAAIAAAPQSLA
jgi:PAS domain S-box-containing protein